MWEETLENDELRNQIRLLLDGQQFIFYFRKGDYIYGAGEDARVTFAKLKDPDEEEYDQEWAKEATFLGVNLQRALEGAKIFNIFGQKDLKQIKVLEREEVEKELTQVAHEAKEKGKLKAGKIPPKPTDDPEISRGMQQLGDKED
jgi:hypothetical protein